MINSKKLPFKWICIVFALLLQDAVASDKPLTVAVAANVKPAFDELAEEFRKKTGLEVQGVFGSTGGLAAQVASGAPFDVFLSADREAPEALRRQGLATTPPKVYAYGVLVLWTGKKIPLDIGIAVLKDPSVHRIAIANPALAPYGRAALQALQRTGLRDAVESKLVYGESIGQTMQFAHFGAADVGLVARSLVVAPEVAGKGKWIDVPEADYEPIAQAVVVLKHGEETQPVASLRFVEFLSSPQAKSVFEKKGYLLQ